MNRFRLATLGDAPGLVDLHNKVADDLTNKLGRGYWSKLRSIARMRDRILESEGRPESRSIYVREEAGELVATIMLSTRRAQFWRKSMWLEPDAPALCVYDLAVPPEKQGLGFGRLAMGFAEEAARSYKLPFVRLDAFARNPHSTAFYSHLGYEDRGELLVGGVPLILYEKRM